MDLVNDGGSAPCLRSPPVVLSATVAGLLSRRLWCVVEVRGADAPWEPRLIVLKDDVDAVVAVVAGWPAVAGESVRVAGYARDTLRRVAFAPAALVC